MLQFGSQEPWSCGSKALWLCVPGVLWTPAAQEHRDHASPLLYDYQIGRDPIRGDVCRQQCRLWVPSKQVHERPIPALESGQGVVEPWL